MTDIFYKTKSYNKYYYENKEKILKQEKLYYQKNKDIIKEKQRSYFRKYYLLNKEKIIENSQRRYYGSISAIPDKIQKINFCNNIIDNNIIIRLMD